MGTATSWLDTSGATVLLTGLVSVVSLAVGVLLRPTVEKRIRRLEEDERWTREAQELTADLQLLLFGGFSTGFLHGSGEEAVSAWIQDGRRRTMQASQFAPTAELRKRARKVRVEFERLAGLSMRVIKSVRQGQEPRPEDERRREETYGEASLALQELVEKLGGPKAPKRDEFHLTLRGED